MILPDWSKGCGNLPQSDAEAIYDFRMRQEEKRNRTPEIVLGASGFLERLDKAFHLFRAIHNPELDWKDVATAVGLAASRISEMRAGTRGVKLPEAEALALALKVRPAWLAFGDGDIYPAAAASTTDKDFPYDPGRSAYQDLAAEERRQRRVAESDPDDRGRSAPGREGPSVAKRARTGKRGT